MILEHAPVSDTIPCPAITAAESVESEEHSGLDLLGELERLRRRAENAETEAKDRAIAAGGLRVEVAHLETENLDLREQVADLEDAVLAFGRAICSAQDERVPSGTKAVRR